MKRHQTGEFEKKYERECENGRPPPFHLGLHGAHALQGSARPEPIDLNAKIVSLAWGQSSEACARGSTTCVGAFGRQPWMEGAQLLADSIICKEVRQKMLGNALM